MMIVRLDKLSNQHCHCITLHCFFPVLFSNIKLKSLHILLNNPLNIILWNYDAKQFYSPRGRGGCSPLLGETVRQWDSETVRHVKSPITHHKSANLKGGERVCDSGELRERRRGGDQWSSKHSQSVLPAQHNTGLEAHAFLWRCLVDNLWILLSLGLPHLTSLNS